MAKKVQIDVDADLFRECVDAIERIGQRAGYGLMESTATVDEILSEMNTRYTSGKVFYKRVDIVNVLNEALRVGFIRVV